MIYTLQATALSGEISIPSSKSVSHRYLICAALAKGESIIKNLAFCDDIIATLDAIEALGCRVEKHLSLQNTVRVFGGNFKSVAYIDANESGSTLRFFMPIVAALGIETTFVGRGELPRRPFVALADALIKNGAQFSCTNMLPSTITNRIFGGIYDIVGNVSSQFISGLLFALPLLCEPSKINLLSVLESKSYCDMTIAALDKFGVTIDSQDKGFFIKANQQYIAQEVQCEGDFSSATFWLCAGAMRGSILIKGLSQNSLQGDIAIIDIISKIGASVTWTADGLLVSAGQLLPCDIDASDIPDAIPALLVLLSQCKGESRVFGTGRLALKESDRRNAMITNLTALGADIHLCGDTIVVRGGAFLTGGHVSGFGDHRIVMSMAIAATACTGELRISGCEAVSKSYRDFWQHFRQLGGIYAE